MTLWYVKYIIIFIVFVIYQLLHILNIIDIIPRSIFLFIIHPLYGISWILLFNIFENNRWKKGELLIYLLCILMCVLLITNLIIYDEKLIFKYSEVIQLLLLSWIIYHIKRNKW